MPNPFVQSTGLAASSAATSHAKAFDSAVVSGHWITVGILSAGATTVTVTDNLGNTYHQAGGYQSVGSANLSLWYAYNITGGSCTVTVTPSSSAKCTFGIHEYSGSLSTDPKDGTANGGGTGTSPVTSSCAVNNANELVFAVLSYNASINPTITPGTGFTNRYTFPDNTGSPWPIACEDGVFSSATTPGWTLSANSSTYGALAASFQFSSAPASTPSVLPLLGIGP